jgi:hypothetical protein
MRSSLTVGLVLAVSTIGPAGARYCAGGQQPVPPSIAERMALPLCGIAATHDWGPNGCQLCDSRNTYPNPFGAYGQARSAPRR